MNSLPFYMLLAIFLLAPCAQAAGCLVCGNCTACGPDVMADGYLNDIDALLQAKVQNLGYPLTISRNATSAAITYTIQYSSGLLIVLQLSLANMQVQLLSYSINSATPAPVPPAPSAPTPTYKTTADGYFILENFNSSKQVSEIMAYLESVVKTNLTNFELVGVQFTNTSALLYRLSFKVLPVSSALISVIETVLVQYISTNNCLLINSNYSALNSTFTWNALDNTVILSDTFISAINTLLINKYNNLLGNIPTIVSIAVAPPYYQLVYQVDSTNYSFIVLYDYFQNRILQGNLTTSKAVTTYTQSTSNSTQTSSGFSQSVVSTTTTNGSSGSSNAPIVTVSPSVVASQSTFTSSSSSENTSSTTNSSNSDYTTLAQSSSNQSAGPSIQPTTYQEVAHFQSNTEVISAVNYLASVGQRFNIKQVKSVQKMMNGSDTLYKVTIQLDTLGSVSISKAIFYQYVVQVSQDGNFTI